MILIYQSLDTPLSYNVNTLKALNQGKFNYTLQSYNYRTKKYLTNTNAIRLSITHSI